MSIPEKTQVAAIVKSKAEGSDGYAIELEIASFNSQYPTKVTRVTEALAAQLKPGQAANLNLVRQALKKNKDGTIKTGNFPTDYFWGLEGIAQNAPPAPQGQATQPPQQEHGRYTPPPVTRDLRDESIRQQVAVKEVGAMIVAQRYVPPELIVKYWQTVAEWLSCGSITLAAPNPPPQTQEVPQQAPTQGAELFWPSFHNWNELLILASKNAIPSSEVFSILGIGNVNEWKQSIDEAWVKLASAKKLMPESIKR